MKQFIVKIQNHQYVRAFRTALVATVFLVGVIAMQYRYDAIQAEYFDLYAAEHRYVVPATIIKHASFGFQNIFADYYWITAIQALNKWDRKDVYFPEYFRIISTLDSRFEYPYIFATLIVPSKKNPESLIQLSEISAVGMRTLPENWEIPFYTGMQYHVVGKSRERATEYLAIAASKSSAPEYVRIAYALFLTHDATEYQKSKVLFETIYETSNSEETKKIAKERIALLDFMEMLERAALAYKTKNHTYPASVEELARAGFIQLPPEIIGKFTIEIDKTTGKVSLTR